MLIPSLFNLMTSSLIVTFLLFAYCLHGAQADGSNSLVKDHQPVTTPQSSSFAGSEKESKEEYVDYKTPQTSPEVTYLYESFDDVHKFKRTWFKSEAIKTSNGEFKYDGTWDIVVTHQKIRGDYGLRMRSKSKHHAISRKLDRPFTFSGSDLVVQYDVQYRNGQECGGAYLKLLTLPSGNLSLVNDQTGYTIMFGPDKCGSDHRLHFIFAHKNKKTGTIREIHWKESNTITNLADVITDGKWHLFRLVVKPDNGFEIAMDKRVIARGSLLEDFSPPINPPTEIDDPEDIKPEDWDERPEIPDPDAVKPDDWDNDDEPKMIPDPKAKKPKGWLEDEPLLIPDPDAVVPDGWSDEMDGNWEPPMINNPKCESAPGCGPWKPPMIANPRHKGEWKPPMIPNLAYQGKWTPRKIPNPEYLEDPSPYQMQPIDAVAFELWTISDGVVFDNILVTSDPSLADTVAANSYQIKKELNDLETDNWFKNLIKSTNKKPWLWAVYIVVIAVPLVLFIGFCCVSPVSSNSDPFNPKIKATHPFVYKTNHEQHSYRYGEVYKEDESHCSVTDHHHQQYHGPGSSSTSSGDIVGSVGSPACCSHSQHHQHHHHHDNILYGLKDNHYMEQPDQEMNYDEPRMDGLYSNHDDYRDDTLEEENYPGNQFDLEENEISLQEDEERLYPTVDHDLNEAAIPADSPSIERERIPLLSTGNIGRYGSDECLRDQSEVTPAEVEETPAARVHFKKPTPEPQEDDSMELGQGYIVQEADENTKLLPDEVGTIRRRKKSKIRKKDNETSNKSRPGKSKAKKPKARRD